MQFVVLAASGCSMTTGGLKLRAWRTVAAKILFALSLAALSEQAKEGTAPNDVQSRPAAYVLSWPIPLQRASTMASVQRLKGLGSTNTKRNKGR